MKPAVIIIFILIVALAIWWYQFDSRQEQVVENPLPKPKPEQKKTFRANSSGLRLDQVVSDSSRIEYQLTDLAKNLYADINSAPLNGHNYFLYQMLNQLDDSMLAYVSNQYRSFADSFGKKGSLYEDLSRVQVDGKLQTQILNHLAFINQDY